MKCPHCLVEFHVQWFGAGKAKLAPDEYAVFESTSCPACKKVSIRMLRKRGEIVQSEHLVVPKTHARSPLPPQVGEEFSKDYSEACVVIADSQKASAALSRRCLQHILADKGGFTATTLDKQIQAAIDSRSLPQGIAGALDAVRVVGNFAAHPIKSTNSGEIIDVEPEEAEWNLEVIEQLFDFYFVQPEILRAKRERLNDKLRQAGKPELKTAAEEKP